MNKQETKVKNTVTNRQELSKIVGDQLLKDWLNLKLLQGLLHKEVSQKQTLYTDIKKGISNWGHIWSQYDKVQKSLETQIQQKWYWETVYFEDTKVIWNQDKLIQMMCNMLNGCDVQDTFKFQWLGKHYVDGDLICQETGDVIGRIE
tara:strand:+ start:769 stop:1209 length:441 start_codon:yes stop_codon:yes gene_type:complete